MGKKIIFLVLSVAVIACSFAVIHSLYNPVKIFSLQDENKSDRVAEKANFQEEKSDNHQGAKQLNILLLGFDKSTERVARGMNFRTDVIILMSINFIDKKVQMISIPRDSLVRIAGRKNKDKINHAFVWGGGLKGHGFELAQDTVSKVFGNINIDYYAAVDMNVVKEIVNAIGGVDVDVDVPIKMCGRVLSKGFQHLNGQQVVDFARWRYSGNGDIDRAGRQQKILLAAFSKLKETGQITKLPKIYYLIHNKIYTNLDAREIAALALFAKDLNQEDITKYVMPGRCIRINGISYWAINQKGRQKITKDVFGVMIPLESEDHSSGPVTVALSNKDTTTKDNAMPVNGVGLPAKDQTVQRSPGSTQTIEPVPTGDGNTGNLQAGSAMSNISQEPAQQVLQPPVQGENSVEQLPLEQVPQGQTLSSELPGQGSNEQTQVLPEQPSREQSVPETVPQEESLKE